MAEQIRVRMYNVLFGDAILVTVPDEDDSGAPLDRHVLIDVGNVLSGGGGSDEVYAAILQDIVDVTGDHGVDLYVMTHEHMDHVQGLLHGATKLDPPIEPEIDTVWLTRSADPDYYKDFEDAKKAFDRTVAVFDQLERQLAASGEADPAMALMLDNNNPRKTSDCVDHLRTLAPPGRVHYVHRGFDTTAAHPFRRATFDIWAPEEDTSEYYGRFKPMAFGDPVLIAETTVGAALPPAGVDATAFFELVDARAKNSRTNALAIDKAKNNTSVVFTLRWNDRVLLFSGDAEVRSWQTMFKYHEDPGEDLELVPIDFLKVSHHGSHNGTPDDEILDVLLPIPNPRPGPRIAGVSTCHGSYNNVPDEHTSQRLLARIDELITTEHDDLYQDIFIG